MLRTYLKVMVCYVTLCLLLLVTSFCSRGFRSVHVALLSVLYAIGYVQNIE